MSTPTIEDLREAWRAERRHEQQLSESSVHDIAWRLVQAGHQPTAAAVRKVHGGGSPNLIHPALHSFFAGELQDRWVMPKDPDLPKPLMDLWQTCLKAARETASEAMGEARKALDEHKAALEEQAKDLAHREAIMTARSEEAGRREQQVRTRLAHAMRAERMHDKKIQARERQIEQYREQAASLQAECTASDELRRRQEKQIRALTENLDLAISASKEAEGQAKERQQQDSKAMAELAKDKAVLEAKITSLEQHKQRLEKLLGDTEKMLTESNEKQREAKRENTKRHERLTAELAAARNEARERERERDMVRREGDAARQELERERKRFARLQQALDNLARAIPAKQKTSGGADV